MINIDEAIVYEDKNMIICNKCPGWLSQSGRNFEPDMVSALMEYRVRHGEEPYIAIINRLDRPVGGLVLFGKNKKTAAELSSLLQKKGIEKYYMAVVCGKPQEKTGTFTDYIVHDKKNNTSCVTSDKNVGSPAKLEYEVIADVGDACAEDTDFAGVDKALQAAGSEKKQHGRDLSLVRIHLLTGRHHQIRVQFASRGLPLYGDAKYGDGTGKGSNVALCAYRLEINGRVYEVKPQGEIFGIFGNMV